jgi:signal recognition particle receptor subunit beta
LTTNQKQYPELPIVIFANKQDLPNALDPSVISKVMGVDAQSMVAVDLAYRNNLLRSIIHILCNRFNLEVPDIRPDDLLVFIPE